MKIELSDFDLDSQTMLVNAMTRGYYGKTVFFSTRFGRNVCVLSVEAIEYTDDTDDTDATHTVLLGDIVGTHSAKYLNPNPPMRHPRMVSILTRSKKSLT